MANPNNVNFTDVVRQVARKTLLPQTVCKKAIEGFEDVILENVEQGKRVVVRSFGVFYRRDRKEGEGRNIKDGGNIVIKYPSKKQLAFKAVDQHRDL